MMDILIFSGLIIAIVAVERSVDWYFSKKIENALKIRKDRIHWLGFDTEEEYQEYENMRSARRSKDEDQYQEWLDIKAEANKKHEGTK